MNDLMDLFKNYFNFSGTLGRKSYWMAILQSVGVFLALSVLSVVLGETIGKIFALIGSILGLVIVIPFLSAYLRRCKDAGYGTGIAVIGWFLFIPGLIFTLMPTKSKK